MGCLDGVCNPSLSVWFTNSCWPLADWDYLYSLEYFLFEPYESKLPTRPRVGYSFATCQLYDVDKSLRLSEPRFTVKGAWYCHPPPILLSHPDKATSRMFLAQARHSQVLSGRPLHSWSILFQSQPYRLKKPSGGNSSAVHWLGLCASTAEGAGFRPLPKN